MLAVMTEQARLGQDPGGYCPWQVSNWALEGCPVQTARWPLRGSVPGSLPQAEKRSGYPTSVAADRAVSWTPRCRVRGCQGAAPQAAPSWRRTERVRLRASLASDAPARPRGGAPQAPGSNPPRTDDRAGLRGSARPGGGLSPRLSAADVPPNLPPPMSRLTYRPANRPQSVREGLRRPMRRAAAMTSIGGRERAAR